MARLLLRCDSQHLKCRRLVRGRCLAPFHPDLTCRQQLTRGALTWGAKATGRSQVHELRHRRERALAAPSSSLHSARNFEIVPDSV